MLEYNRSNVRVQGEVNVMFYEQLKKFYLFQNIEEETIEKINRMKIVPQSYEAGEAVNYFDDPINYFYVILSGALKTNEYKLDGREIVSSYYFAYDAFPIYLIYGGAKKFPYNVYCHKKAHVLHIPVQPFRELVAADSKLMANVLEFVSTYCRYNKKVIQTVTFTKVNQRLAFWLLSSTDEDHNYIVPGTQQMLADVLLVNRSSLNQELGNFEKEQVIRRMDGKIFVLDRAYLEELLATS